MDFDFRESFFGFFEELNMRKSLLTSLVLGCGAMLGLVSFGASALPIHVGLAPAGGNNSFTFTGIGDPSSLALSGWEFDSGAWTSATMIYKCDNNTKFNSQCPNTFPQDIGPEVGLGVVCQTTPTNNVCGQHEIGATPWQMIDVNISQLVNWQSLTIDLGSINSTGTGGDETGYLLGATCQRDFTGACTTTILGSCTDFGGLGKPATCSFNFTKATLSGITDIWVASSTTNQSGTNNGNILLGGDFVLNSVSVPEPKELGIFGLGLLLIGAFVGLRRRRRQTA